MSDPRHPTSARQPVLHPSKAQATRACILEAGRAFLTDRPFRDLTVGGLMANTDLSRPTFYLYFNDLHGLMETLLEETKAGIVVGAQPWFSHETDAVPALKQSLAALVEVGVAQGPILKAVADAAPSDARLESVWEGFLGAFDELVCARIAEDQAVGRIPPCHPLPIAQALNRMDAGMLIHAFGTAPKADPTQVRDAITRVWLSTLYPAEAAAALHSNPTPIT